MRCKKCGKSTQCLKQICWIDFNLCGNCAVYEHPEIYKKNIINRVLNANKNK